MILTAFCDVYRCGVNSEMVDSGGCATVWVNYHTSVVELANGGQAGMFVGKIVVKDNSLHSALQICDEFE